MTSDYEAIRNTIAKFAFSVDEKDWTLLPEVFTPDCFVDYPAPLGPIQGTNMLQDILEKSIGHLSTQHALSTQMITLTSETSAKTTTYITASHYLGERSFVSMGKLDDVLVKSFDGDEGLWLIKERKVTILGIPQGDWSLLR